MSDSIYLRYFKHNTEKNGVVGNVNVTTEHKFGNITIRGLVRHNKTRIIADLRHAQEVNDRWLPQNLVPEKMRIAIDRGVQKMHAEGRERLRIDNVSKIEAGSIPKVEDSEIFEASELSSYRADNIQQSNNSSSSSSEEDNVDAHGAEELGL